jgi:hypothetical protein
MSSQSKSQSQAKPPPSNPSKPPTSPTNKPPANPSNTNKANQPSNTSHSTPVKANPNVAGGASNTSTTTTRHTTSTTHKSSSTNNSNSNPISTNSNDGSSSHHKNLAVIVGATVGGIVVVAFLLYRIWGFYSRRRLRRNNPLPPVRSIARPPPVPDKEVFSDPSPSTPTAHYGHQSWNSSPITPYKDEADTSDFDRDPYTVSEHLDRRPPPSPPLSPFSGPSHSRNHSRDHSRDGSTSPVPSDNISLSPFQPPPPPSRQSRRSMLVPPQSRPVSLRGAPHSPFVRGNVEIVLPSPLAGGGGSPSSPSNRRSLAASDSWVVVGAQQQGSTGKRSSSYSKRSSTYSNHYQQEDLFAGTSSSRVVPYLSTDRTYRSTPDAYTPLSVRCLLSVWVRVLRSHRSPVIVSEGKSPVRTNFSLCVLLCDSIQLSSLDLFSLWDTALSFSSPLPHFSRFQDPDINTFCLLHLCHTLVTRQKKTPTFRYLFYSSI